MGTDSGAGGGNDGATGGGDTGVGSEGGTAGDAGSVGPFPFPVVAYGGSGLVIAPKVVTVTFPGDALTSSVDTFGTSIASSSYWDTVRAGYCGGGSTCIGDGPAGTSVALTTAPAASYTDSSQGGASTLQTFLAGLISANTLPAPDANTIYVLYFPASTAISLDGAASCNDFDGYHNAMPMGGTQVFYAVVPECAAPMMTPAITTLQNTTITTSHEIAEAASDSGDGYYLDTSNPATWGWNDIAGGEIGDLCVDMFGLGQDETTENGFTVQRIWSITNAAAGKNPCVPIPTGEVYFNAYTKDSVILLDVGQSKTIEVDALADGAMAPWTVTAQDWTGSTTYLTYSLQGGTPPTAGPQVQAASGDRLQLTITLTADPGSSPNGEADGVVVSANGTTTTATKAHYWPFIVMTPAEGADAGVSMMKRRGTRGPSRRQPFGRLF